MISSGCFADDSHEGDESTIQRILPNIPDNEEFGIMVSDKNDCLTVKREGNVFYCSLIESFTLMDLLLGMSAGNSIRCELGWQSLHQPIGIKINPEGIEVESPVDIFYMYLCLAFAEYIRQKESNCFMLAYCLKHSALMNTGDKVKRFQTIVNSQESFEYHDSSIQGRGWWSSSIANGTHERVNHVVSGDTNVNRGDITPSSSASGNIPVVTAEPPKTARQIPILPTIITQTMAPQEPVKVDKSIGLDSFISGLTDKTNSRAAKLLEKAIGEKRFGEEGNRRLEMELTKLSQSKGGATTQQSYNPQEFIAGLEGLPIVRQIELIDKQMKKGEKYGDKYLGALSQYRDRLEEKISRR